MTTPVFKSERFPAYSKKGMVATSQPLAALIGRDILAKGGNAIDAAIATAAALTVCEPTANGIGGDAFVIVWFEGKLYGLNASGRAPSSISAKILKEKGFETMPQFGVLPITIPGVPKAWADLNERFGNLSFLECLEPAAKLAEDGYSVNANLSYMWNRANQIYQEKFTGPSFQGWFDMFAPGAKAPQAGQTWSHPPMAATLRDIGNSNAASFYNGHLAKTMVDFIQAHDGYLSLDDLANHQNTWVDPISIHYKGVDVFELPPNGQGIVALQALGMMASETHPLYEERSLHRQMEAMKLSFADAMTWVTDPEHMTIPVEDFLDPTYLASRKAMITEQALEYTSGLPSNAGTVYLCAADGEGNMVSYIQSNFYGFGSGIVIPNTGISMQNRGFTFSLDETHANVLAPNKRTYHTIIPGFLMKDQKPLGPFGIMGGYTQPQAHLQFVMHLIDHQLNPQAALDAPRWQWMKDKVIHVESTFPSELVEALRKRGHDVVVIESSISFGRGEAIIWDEENQTYIGGTETRTDGLVAIL